MRGDFDLQAHRGGIGLTVENTLAAFEAALAVGVTTLECDVHVSADGVAMLTHDRHVLAHKARDTVGAYVGRLVAELTLAQLRTLDVGSQTQPDYPHQRAVPGAVMPTLVEVLVLARRCGVRVHAEMKYDARHAGELAPREQLVAVTAAAIADTGMLGRVSVQSFDLELLRMFGRALPPVDRYVLIAPEHLRAGHDQVRAAADEGFEAISPAHGEPFLDGVDDPAYVPFVTAALVEDAHERGLRVVPWTVDDPATIGALVDLGVDGVITNYPDRARRVLATRGIALPDPVTPR